ncbi:MAG: hypothetical protein ACK42I_08330 [Thermomicrobium sp.]
MPGSWLRARWRSVSRFSGCPSPAWPDRVGILLTRLVTARDLVTLRRANLLKRMPLLEVVGHAVTALSTG